MKTILKLSLLVSAACALSTPAAAQIDLWSGWSGEAGISGSTTSGNTDTSDVGLALGVAKESGLWTHNFDATYDLGSVSGTDTKNRLFLGYQIDRDFTDRLYGYGNANYFSDDFGAYEEGYFLGAGLGYHVLVDKPITWAVEGGIGYRDQTLALTNTSEGEFALRAHSDFDYYFNEAVSFYNDTEVIWSDSDTYTWNDIGLAAQLSGNLYAKFGVRVDHHSDVPAGVASTDTTTRGSLVYKIN